jgi:hypothetical protein
MRPASMPGQRPFAADHSAVAVRSPSGSERGCDSRCSPSNDPALAGSGIDILVSLLSDPEAIELSLGQEGPLAQALGIDFHRLPTPDRHVPDRNATITLAATLAHKNV